MVAEKPGDLVEHDGMILNLNTPDKIADVSWIKPGKMIRVMTQTTASAKAYVDFAAQQNLQYILFDWKWYGPAFSFGSDATKVALPDLDLPGVIRYAKEKGVGVWLYVNQQALFAQSDSLFSIYHSWGVKGVKFGFVQVGSHRWTAWLEDAIRKAADNRLMVDIHDDYRPTGEQRTYPNLMTAEGIRGNEEMPDATHNTILPFTRFLAGPADYTICYYDRRIKTTHAHQLALAVVYYSPVQTVFWYDKPSDYRGEPEIEFLKHVPTVWDDTRVLQGGIGKYITTARRSGADWFVGTITNDSARTLRVPLGFLSPHQKYTAHLYTDDPSVPTRTHVRVETREVDDHTVLDVSLLPSGGQAIWLTPA
jgi:alpha-glucosidase